MRSSALFVVPGSTRTTDPIVSTTLSCTSSSSTCLLPNQQPDQDFGTASGARSVFPSRSSRYNLPSFEVLFQLSAPAEVSCSADCGRRAEIRVVIWNCELSDQSNDYCCFHAGAVLDRFERLVLRWCTEYPDPSIRGQDLQDLQRSPLLSPVSGSIEIPDDLFTVRFLYAENDIENCARESCGQPGIALVGPSAKPGCGICVRHLAEAVSSYRLAVQEFLHSRFFSRGQPSE
jgi:hypothetical protein